MLTANPILVSYEPTIGEKVTDLNRMVTQMWWECSSQLPALSPVYSVEQQRGRAKKLDGFIDGILLDIRSMPTHLGRRDEIQDRILTNGFGFAQEVLGLQAAQIDLIRRKGFIEVTREFARMARDFDPHITAADIYQASRNVMTMNFMQLLLGRPVEMTPSVFAYSMLYPYTDNYLDDPAVSAEMKWSFNERFQRRLAGDKVAPRNPHEQAISRLVEMIESQYDRPRYPLVYHSLLAIHAAQARSLRLTQSAARPGLSPFEKDVVGITFEKGGTSVLADGYLVAGHLSSSQAAFMYAYGAFTQMMDDLEDVAGDRDEGSMTLFSQTAGRWPLDALLNKALRFGMRVFNDLWDFHSPEAQTLHDLILQNIHPIMLDTAYQHRDFFSPGYIKEIEKYMPFPFSAMEKQRRKLKRHKASFSGLVDVLS